MTAAEGFMSLFNNSQTRNLFSTVSTQYIAINTCVDCYLTQQLVVRTRQHNLIFCFSKMSNFLCKVHLLIQYFVIVQVLPFLLSFSPFHFSIPYLFFLFGVG